MCTVQIMKIFVNDNVGLALSIHIINYISAMYQVPFDFILFVLSCSYMSQPSFYPKKAGKIELPEKKLFKHFKKSNSRRPALWHCRYSLLLQCWHPIQAPIHVPAATHMGDPDDWFQSRFILPIAVTWNCIFFSSFHITLK